MDDISRPTGPEGRNVDAGQGMAWWSQAWALFMKNAGLWIVFGLIFIFGSIFLEMLPILGTIVSSLLTPVLIGGWMMAARKLDQGGTLEVSDLFAGFGPKLSSLLLVGVAVLVCKIVFGGVIAVFGIGAFGSFFGGAALHSNFMMMTGLGMGMVSVLLLFVLAFVLIALMWFAPALVALGEVPPVDALKASASMSLRNVGAFTVFGLLSLLFSILATLPAGLGWIVLFPVGTLAMYTSYQDLFGR